MQYSKTTLGTTDLTLGSTALELAGLQKLTVDNIEINNNSITAKNENGNIDLVPNGNGTVDVSSKRITSVANPEQSTDAANKAYVDSATQGLHVHSPVIAATTDTLTNITGGTVSYDNGTLGVGAFITLQNPLTELDTIHLTALDRILVKNETNQAYNGIYTYTNSTTLTRATDSDQAFEFAGGDFLFVTSGQINGNNGYVQTQKVTTMGSDAIIFEQFSGAGQIVAGAGLTKTGNQLDVQVDNSTIEIVADTLQVKDSGITANQLATDSVTTAKIKDGDVTNAKLANSKITIIASDASTDDISLGETLTITNGEAIVSSISSNTLSFTARKATSSLTGVAYFPTANFTVTDGSVAISTIDGGTF